MKHLIFSLFVCSLAFVACKKEVTFDDQLVGNWVSTNVKIGGNDVTATYALTLNVQASHEFDADLVTKQLIGSPTTTTYTGEWTADEIKQEIELKYDGGEKETYDITSINGNIMKATVVVNTERREFVFEKSGQ